jgi:type II secretory pathway component GspD/PulD (secretin)
MRNALKFLLSGALLCGAVSAMSETVDEIMKDLSAYQKSEAAAVGVVDEGADGETALEEPATDADADAQTEVAGWETALEEPAADAGAEVPVEVAGWETALEESAVDADAEAAVEAGEWETVLEDSQALFVDGEFVKAQQGFEKVLKANPENLMARTYLRSLQERDHRRARDQGLSAVDAAWKTDVVLRSYPLADDARDKMMLTDVKQVTHVESLFPQVKFSKGSSAIYQPKSGLLYVRNTHENLELLEVVLDAMGILKSHTDVDQVEIEAKFVEVSEGALEELGFQWNFDDPVGVRAGGTDLNIYDGSGLFSDGLRGSPSGTSPELPFRRVNELGAGEMSAGEGDWNTFRFEDTFNKYPSVLGLEYQGTDPVEMLISALDQQSGTDVLSAPRILTEDGETATIRVGQRHFYPEVYETGADEGNIAHVEYQDFEEKLLGVELEVTPAVKGENITLKLNPQIMELVSWQNYEVAPADSSYTYYQFRLGFKFYHKPIVARLPVFKKRAINTIVTIADGGTIGMGGLINERTESYEDSVPVLGRIPLIGRLFRNEGERLVKRNLLMFVTARKIEPNGRINMARSFE